ncbi:efflux RND transporter periplasmic adaptor subunit [uncultured Allofournierella sp.]|uniref:efflux RND transporter periplasmic adaptor subunit n=1 Tax=uncultured Allofournierella sp. TaxID=1940258 RepID=UPI0025E0D975|nr:efflux RND transporter periplasmic adaptor subunit [uncultured Fournierella sp.]
MAIKIFSPILKHKRAAAAILAVAILAAGGAVALRVRMSASKDNTAENLSYARTVFLKKEDLNESVNVSGIVQSAQVSSVTTGLSNKVTSLNVKVGDHVNKGDVICTLDDADIRRAIQDKEKEIGEEKQRLQEAYNKAVTQVDEARRAKDNEKKNQDTLVDAARAARDRASEALSAVTPAYDAAKANYEVMEKAVASAQKDVDAATDARQKAYDAWIAAGGATEGDAYLAYQKADETLNEKNTALESARTLYSYDSYTQAYNTAKQAYDAAAAERDTAESAYKQADSARYQALDACDTTINTALSALQEAEKQLQKGVDSKALDDLKKSLEDTILKAETSGKITDLKVNVGSICKGDVATIQSTDQLVLSVSIPEYAINKVQVGMPASITSDAASGEIRGTVSRISPTAGSGDGESTGSSSGFAADIAIQTPESIFIGSKAKAEIILASKSNVYSVPLDAVAPGDDGQDVIYARQGEGAFSPVTVTTGMKNDYAVEVSGTSLQDGLEILADASQMPDTGAPVPMGGADSASTDSSASASTGEVAE